MDIHTQIKVWEASHGYESTPYKVRLDADGGLEAIIGDGIDSAAAVAEINAVTEADADAYEAAVDAERRNTPIVQDQPLEVPVLVLQSFTEGIGVGVISDNAGELSTFTYHASPIPPPAEIKARKVAALEARAARKARIAIADTSVKAARGKAEAAGNSIPALREAVADLAAAVELLMAEQK